MKGNSGSVWRTVLLAAFMCLAAGEAYGYEVWKSGKILVKEDCVLLVENGKEIEVDDLFNQEGIVVIAMGASVKLDHAVQITSGGKVYVFGNLDLTKVQYSGNNEGTIYRMATGQVYGSLDGGKIVSVDEKETIAMISTGLVKGQMPSKSNKYVGWKDCYAKGMVIGDDFVPLDYYEDEQCIHHITNIELWREHDGRLEGYYFTLGDANYHATYHYFELILDGDMVFPDKAEYRCDEDDILVSDTNTIAYSREF